MANCTTNAETNTLLDGVHHSSSTTKHTPLLLRSGGIILRRWAAGRHVVKAGRHVRRDEIEADYIGVSTVRDRDYTASRLLTARSRIGTAGLDLETP